MPRAEPGPRVARRLLRARALVVEAAQQLVEERGEVAGVVDGAGAERLGAAVVRHLVGADQIAPPDLGGVEAEAGRAQVHQPLADEVALRAPGRAQRARRRLVGDDRPEVAGVARHAIRAGEERGAELGGHERGGAHVGADVRADQRAQPEDAPVRVEADLDLVLDLARVVGRHQALAALLDPPDGAAELHGGERHQDVLGIELAAHAEAAAHVHLGQAQRAERGCRRSGPGWCG